MTPLVTVTPRLEQEIRCAQTSQQLGNGYQFALRLTVITTTPVLTPIFDHGPLLTARLAF